MVVLAKTDNSNFQWLRVSLASTFLWGLAANGYAFFDNSFSWDSLLEMHSGVYGNDLRMISGRYFVPLYRDLFRSDVTLPWLVGLLALFYLALSVFLVIRLFRVESKLTAFLIAGIFTANVTISAAAATYLHDLDSFGVSLLCAVGAVFLWKEKANGWLLGAPLITLSLGMYQSYVFTSATLVMIVSILALLDAAPFREIFRNGLLAVAMVLLGGALYYIGLKTIVPLSGEQFSSGAYNSMDLILQIQLRQLPELIGETYRDWFTRIWQASSVYPAILVRLMHLFLFAGCIGVLFVWLQSKQSGWKEKILCLLLVALLPLVMNMLKLLTLGMNHDLMVFAIWMVYLLALLLADWLVRYWKEGKLRPLFAKWQQRSCLLLVALTLWGNVQLANGMYLKKDFEYDAYLSMMTRVAARMENCDGYVPGETPVLFIGMPDVMNQLMPGFKDYWDITGMEFSDIIYAPEVSRFQAYFDYVLGMPLLLAESSACRGIWQALDIEAIAPYPGKDCIFMQDGILVVKLGEAWGTEPGYDEA